MTDIPRFCSYCGSELRSNARFCNRCGKPTPFQPAPAVAPPPVPMPPPSPPPIAAQPAPAPAPVPIPPTPASRQAATGEAQDKRRRLLIVGGVVLALGLLLVCALLAYGGYWFYLRPTSTPTVTGTPPTATPTGTITPATPTNTGTITPATPTGSPSPSPSVTSETPLPTTAPAAQVDFSGVSFSYHPSLAAGVSTEKRPASGLEVPYLSRLPEHVALTLRGFPFVPDDDPLPQVLVIPLPALESLNPDAALEIEDLRDLLSRKPVEFVDPDDTIPFIPLKNISQAFQGWVGYLDFKNGNGVRYITQYNQEPYPINNNGIFYTFQGLTHDGRYYISASFPLSNSILPDPSTLVVDEGFRSRYNSYIREREVELSSQPANSFTPGLSLLDALIQSLQVQ